MELYKAKKLNGCENLKCKQEEEKKKLNCPKLTTYFQSEMPYSQFGKCN